MLAVTQEARTHLAGLLDTAEVPEDVAIRLVREGRDIALQVDNARSGDATFDHEGRTVLVLDDGMKTLLDDRTLDVEVTDDGPRLALR